MNRIIFFAVAILSVSLFSCKDDDDDNNESESIITTDVVKTDNGAYSLGNAVYGPLQTLSSSFSFLLESHTETTISFEGAETAGGPEASRLETTPGNSYANKLFDRLYQSIGSSNIAIQKLDSSRVDIEGGLSQGAKDLVIARVKFTRALSYLYLVQIYGEVPLKLTPADASKNERVAIDQIYEQIVKDLEEAEKDLPAFDQIRSNPNKGAANGLLARAYLTWGQKPLSQAEVEGIKTSKTDPVHSVDAAKLQKAVEYADKVINSGNFSLEPDFNSNFGVVAENRSVEHIYTIHHDGDNKGDAQGNHQTHCPFTERFNLLIDNHIGPADVTLVNRFDDNDQRKLLSIVEHLYNGDEPNPANTPKFNKYDYVFPVTSPRYGKFIHRRDYAANIEVAPGSAAAQPNDINRIELRYAEVLLYKAEALFFLGKAGEALPIVNQLRERAFGGHYEHYALSTLTEEDLYKEWDLELSFEQKHWQNLVRWKKLISTVQTVKDFEYYKEAYKDEEAVKATAAAKGFTNTEDKSAPNWVNAPFFAKIYKHLHAKDDHISGKFYRFPIPVASGIDKGVKPQNPGY
ncbi:MAG: RagB/SusD family nutrient uptake outer membrane protein [Bacteroidales bacterium]|jgi:hypothetical protein|nr:RagB/SusD family nutrient uptake outer membrane protein [Bacteroidales bacterium]